MFNSLGGFHFKPTEEEMEMRRKLEEERKAQAGVTTTTTTTTTTNNNEKQNNDSAKSTTTTTSSSSASSSSPSSSSSTSTSATSSASTTAKAKPTTTTTTTATTAAPSPSPTKVTTNNSKSTNEENKQDDRPKSTKTSSSATKNNSKNDAVGKSKIETSSYYFSKTTDPEKAKEFKPKKIDEQIAQEKEKEKAANTVGSLWNTGSTMEEYDYSEWIHQRLKEELLKVEFKSAPIKISEVEDIGGTATYLFARGKLRAGWDLNFKAKWKGTVDSKEVEGSIAMEDITDSDDSDDWEFQAGAQKSDSEHEKGRRIVINEKKTILKAITGVLAEFKAKRSSK